MSAGSLRIEETAEYDALYEKLIMRRVDGAYMNTRIARHYWTKIRKLPPTAPARRSVAVGPYVDFFWRYGFMALALMAFVSVYRMGDVLALNLSKPMIRNLGYSLTEIGLADSGQPGWTPPAAPATQTHPAGNHP